MHLPQYLELLLQHISELPKHPRNLLLQMNMLPGLKHPADLILLVEPVQVVIPSGAAPRLLLGLATLLVSEHVEVIVRDAVCKLHEVVV